MDKKYVDREVQKAMRQVEKAMGQVKLAEKQAKQAEKDAKSGKTSGIQIVTQRGNFPGLADGAAFVHKSSAVNGGTYIHINQAKNIQIGDNNTMYIGSKKKKSGRRRRRKSEDEDEDDTEVDAAVTTEEDVEEIRRLPVFSSKRVVTDEDIDIITTSVSKWRIFFRFLGLEESEIEHAYEEYFHVGGVKEVLYQGMKKWQSIEALGASIDIVARALLKAECPEAIRELQP